VSVADLDLDVATADRLIGLADPSLRATAVKRLTGGGNSGVFDVATTSGRAVVVKVYSEIFDWKLEKELYVYDRVRKQGLDLPMAEILAADDSKSLIPNNVVVMTKREGWHVLSLLDELSDRDLESINRQIGVLLRTLHEVTFDAFGYIGTTGVFEPHPTNDAYMRFQFEKKLREFGELGGREELRRMIERYVAERVELLAGPGAALCHDDCHEGNILVLPSGDGWRISGLLDFENAVAGDPLLDLAKVHCYSRRPSEGRLTALVDGYGPVRDDWRATLDLYVVYHLIALWDWFTSIGETESLAGIADQLRRLAAQ
jgi:aminoglycoside phosphotransferase (APT) family kinase protein